MSEVEHASSEIATVADEALPVRRNIDSPPGGWTGVELGELYASGRYIAARHSDIVRLSVALACWEAISQDIAKTPLELRRRTPNGSIVVEPGQHPVADLLWTRPSEYYGWREFIRMMAAYLAAARGYSVAARFDRRLRPLELQGVPLGQLQPLLNVEAGRYFYEVLPQSDHERIQWKWMENAKLTPSEIVTMRLRSLNGFDPIANSDIAGEALTLLKDMSSFQSTSFSTGGVGLYAVAFPESLTDVQFERLRAGFAESFETARRTGKPMVLEGADGVIPEVKRLSMSAVDQDFVKSQAGAMHDVLRYFRMPPTKVGLFESVKYDNMDPINRLYVDDTLAPIFDCIEDGLDQLLLSTTETADLFFQFDRETAYGLDPKERDERYLAQWKAGAIEYDELRRKLGHNTYGGKKGQVRMFSGNFVLIDRDNEVVLKAGGNAPGAEGDQAPQDGAGADAKDKGIPGIGAVVPTR